MMEPHRPQSASERWLDSIERSRRRRAITSTRRRGVAGGMRRSAAIASALVLGSVAVLGGALVVDGGSSETYVAPTPAASLTPAPHAGTPARNLKLGSRGEAVTAVERRLAELGFEVQVDHYFDEGTDRAVRVFQGNAGFEVDGIVGARTWNALFSAKGTVGPGASQGNAGSPVEPERGGGGRKQLDFAVRRASPNELNKLNLGRELSGPKERGAGLVAIELRTPARAGAEGSSNQPAGQSEGRSLQTSSNAWTKGSETSGTGTTQPNTGTTQRPPVTTQPATSSCTTSLRHPLSSPYSSTRYITSPFGPRWGRLHAGIDIGAPTGTPIRAAACGLISYYGWSGTTTTGYGRYACVRHTSTFTTCYAHMSRFANLRVGSYVATGQLIGYVGNSGSSTGPHLHLETRSGLWGTPSNPHSYLYSGKQMSGTPVRRTASIGGPDLEPGEVGGALTSLAAPAEDRPSTPETPADDRLKSAPSQPSPEHGEKEAASAITGGTGTSTSAAAGGEKTGEPPVTSTVLGNPARGDSSAAEGSLGRALYTHPLEEASNLQPEELDDPPVAGNGEGDAPVTGDGEGDEPEVDRAPEGDAGGAREISGGRPGDIEQAGAENGVAGTSPPAAQHQPADAGSTTIDAPSSADGHGLTPFSWTPPSQDAALPQASLVDPSASIPQLGRDSLPAPCWEQRCP